MRKRTTLQVEREMLKELKSCKNFERETYNEVLKRLLKGRKR